MKEVEIVEMLEERKHKKFVSSKLSQIVALAGFPESVLAHV